jgi:pimeloyl-ACP methyl ester carboxylesterase
LNHRSSYNDWYLNPFKIILLFFQASVRPGLAAAQTAVIFKNLMNRLGHKKFYVQGGDWGSLVVSSLSVLYPEDILGHHTNSAGVMVIYVTYIPWL